MYLMMEYAHDLSIQKQSPLEEFNGESWVYDMFHNVLTLWDDFQKYYLSSCLITEPYNVKL